MGMSSSPTPPTAPDPVATAAAQANTNKTTAITQDELNSQNQITPQGSLSYRQIGTWDDGTPRFEATTSYSPEQDAIYKTGAQNEQKLGTLAGSSIDRVSDLLSKPVDLSNDATEARTMDLARRRLDPILATRRSGLENKLSNQGIAPGSEAWNTQMRQLGQDENDAYDNLILTGHGQSVSDILAGRNQPINEITALMSGSQVNQPNWVGTPQTSVAPTDYSGIVQSNYGAATDQYKTNVGRQNAMMGGLFGLAAAPLGGFARNGFSFSPSRG